MPLPLVEAGQLAAAFAGLLLLVLARGLARGYRGAFKATMALLLLAGFASLLKGLDWEEAVVLGDDRHRRLVAVRAVRSRERRRLAGMGRSRSGVRGAAAVPGLRHRSRITSVPRAFERWTAIGYRLQARALPADAPRRCCWPSAPARTVRAACGRRSTSSRPTTTDIERALDAHADIRDRHHAD